jgi:hypothetical protein
MAGYSTAICCKITDAGRLDYQFNPSATEGPRSGPRFSAGQWRTSRPKVDAAGPGAGAVMPPMRVPRRPVYRSVHQPRRTLIGFMRLQTPTPADAALAVSGTCCYIVAHGIPDKCALP